MSDPVEVLDYWLGELGPEGWYAGGEELDAGIRDRFGDLWQAAADGGLDHWTEGPAGVLAFIVVTDQFPRNMWRGSAKAFSTDAMALAAARKAIAAGWDMEVPEPERQFFYLPFMHSEDLADQEECIDLMVERMPETGASNVLHARAHTEIIRRFGRFPYRNAAFGREMTADEQAFLDGGGYMSVVESLKSPE
ncbi:Uncharacterized conserved protein, DUF924 family [Gemmobacter megaterium]|uniref:Uncharacterized conserved protein, DUF924 family n=1 Tax=Gemmobacter megaterium TaxID=1086013 RepID=A0A1N7NTD3_9RHOB|nr:DUF924 family protein [Gemmobacter megaterium]GGE16751.1 hypothetical protein GCM10011345_23350 [Gemmobacter megaterium]SIT01570.1 Uncharacterized conserved protein, DUF924 family [Gemmobacter megaterium]